MTIHDHKYPEDDHIEAITIIIKPNYLPKTIPWIGLIGVYIPPSDTNNKLITDYIASETDRLLSINSKASIYILGDFNNSNMSFISRFPKFKQLVVEPTRGTNILDKCFTNASYTNELFFLPPIEASDHSTILIKPIQHSQSINSMISLKIREKKRSNFDTMGRTLADMDWSIWKCINDINIKADMFHGFLCSLYAICFPLKSIVVKNNNPPWITAQILSMIKVRNENYSKMDKSITEQMNVNIKRQIKISKQKYMKSFITTSNYRSQEFYQKLNRITGAKEEVGRILFPNKSINDTNREILKYFNDLAIIHASVDPESIIIDNSEADFPIIEIQEVFRELSSLKGKGSESPYDIPPSLYKEFSIFLAEPITDLINMSLNLHTCPNLWKKSYLIPIPKNKNPHSPNEIRPISITSPLAKLSEKIILKMTLDKINHNLDKAQFGGIKGSSINHYLSIYIDRIYTNLTINDNSAYTLISDYKKAYDNVNHQVIFQNLNRMGATTKQCRWIASFLHHREQYLRSNIEEEQLSFIGSNGIPQGTVMGSFLFAVVVNFVLNDLEGVQKYVDDLTFTSNGKRDDDLTPQMIFDKIKKESTLIDLPLNIAKCSFISFNFKREKINIDVDLDGIKLVQSTSFTLLGIIIQSDLKWDSHIESILVKANKKLHILYKMRKMGLGMQAMKMVYISNIRSLLEYGAPIWHAAITKKQVDNLECIQSRALKIIMGNNYRSRAHSLEALSLDSLFVRRSKLHRKFALEFLMKHPEYKPLTQGDISGILTRKSYLLKLPFMRTVRQQRSPICSYLREFNNHLELEQEN